MPSVTRPQAGQLIRNPKASDGREHGNEAQKIPVPCSLGGVLEKFKSLGDEVRPHHPQRPETHIENDPRHAAGEPQNKKGGRAAEDD